MSHSLSRVWIHAVFGTKDRKPLLRPDFAQGVHDHIKTYLEELGCSVRLINGTADHVHLLFLLGHQRSISQVMKSVKSESSHWINQHDFHPAKFAWQVGYGLFSVSESGVEKVERYIEGQKEHHRNVTFREEFDYFMRKYDLKEYR
ncbi:MAG: IS200/IS605 family transposase [Fidelibacterota bacterium]